MPQTATTPPRILGLYDAPFWDLLDRTGRLHLQRCGGCGAFRYPPGPTCPECLDDAGEWAPCAGTGTLLSWVMFRRQYLPAYPAPYNVVAVRLDEGPVMISNLVEDPAEAAAIIDARVRLAVVRMADGVALPRFALD